MTTESMRERFDVWYAENAFGYAQNFASSRDCGLQWKAWQAATLAERERCAKVCESMRDLREEARAALKAAEALKGGNARDIVDRLSHEQTVHLYNGAMDKCAEAIRKGES